MTRSIQKGNWWKYYSTCVTFLYPLPRSAGSAHTLLLWLQTIWHLRASKPHSEHYIWIHGEVLQGGQRCVPRCLRSPGGWWGRLHLLVRLWTQCFLSIVNKTTVDMFSFLPAGSPTQIFRSLWRSKALDKTTASWNLSTSKGVLIINNRLLIFFFSYWREMNHFFLFLIGFWTLSQPLVRVT